MRITVIHNPTAGDTDLSRDVLDEILVDAGYQVRYQTTKGEWKKALQEPADLVVVVGGDGTVRKVATQLAGADVPITVLPFGTANNVAKTLGIHGRLGDIVKGWERLEPRPLDIGCARGPWGERRFVESAGGGVFAELIARGSEEVEGASLIVGRETDRALDLLRGLVETATPQRWELEVDGQDHSGDYIGVEVLNIRFTGPNVPLAPSADVGDGFFDVVALGPSEQSRLIQYIDERIGMASAGPLDFLVRQARHVLLVPPPGASLHVDDVEWLPDDDDRTDGRRRPIELEMQPGAASVLTKA
jgi:diacylglycerol kinase family enzyme